MSNTLSQWLRLATPLEREALAKYAGTTVRYLYQLCGHPQFRRRPNVVLAVGIEAGTKKAALRNPKLPVVTVIDLVGLFQ